MDLFCIYILISLKVSLLSSIYIYIYSLTLLAHYYHDVLFSRYLSLTRFLPLPDLILSHDHISYSLTIFTEVSVIVFNLISYSATLVRFMEYTLILNCLSDLTLFVDPLIKYYSLMILQISKVLHIT